MRVKNKNSKIMCVHPKLYKISHVFIRYVARRKAFQPVYDELFKLLSRQKHF